LELVLDKSRAIAYRGNWQRIKSLMQSLNMGKEATVAFIGGSITQGCNASKDENSYAYIVYQWFVKRFPDSDIRYINAGIGATSSQYAVARVDEDVLKYRPDFVFVEFSVNDDNTDFFMETYEGLIRRILYSEYKPAVMLLHNIKYDDGYSSAREHLAIGKYYDLPSCSIADVLHPLVCAKECDAKDITTDYLHPNDKGHRLSAECIIYFLDEIYKALDEVEEPSQNKLSPLTRNRYEQSRLFCSKDMDAVCDGFVKDTRKKKSFLDHFKGGWYGRNKGDKITFEIYGSAISLLYRQTINKPSPVARVCVDGRFIMELDSNFEEDWGENLRIDNILPYEDRKYHTIELEIVDSQDVISDFYLLSIIVS